MKRSMLFTFFTAAVTIAVVSAASITAVTVAAALTSCRLFHMMPVTITAWTPAEKSIDPEDDVTVSVTFSAEMNKTSAEEAFSLTVDDDAAAGKYVWDAGGDENTPDKHHTLIFAPHTPLEQDRTYTVAVGTSAEDIRGNNLRADFVHMFYTGNDRKRPEIESILPEHGTSIDRPRLPVVLAFSEPIDRASLYEGFGITPSAEGVFTWTEDDSVVTFTPNRDYTRQQWYTVTVEPGVEDVRGNKLGDTFTSSFYTGTDTVPPRIIRAENGEGTAELLHNDGGPAGTPEDPLIITGGWETDGNIRLVFSEPVLFDGIEESISIDPPAEFEVTKAGVTGAQELTGLPTVTEAVIHFDERLAFDTLYSLCVETGSEGGITDLSGNTLLAPEGEGHSDYLYRFRTDGAGSKPPEIVRVVFLEEPGGSPPPPEPRTVICSPFDLIDLSAYNQAGGRTGYFDLYVALADGADIDYISFIEHFSLTCTNGCADIDILAAETGPYSGGPIDPPAGEGEQAVRVQARIREHPENGVILFRLGDRFSDSTGNLIADEWLFYLQDHTP